MDNKAFDYKRIAEGYKNRPFLHKQVIERLQRDMNVTHFYNGLDIGCGAGLSTKALKLVCDKVTGTDISEEMILAAREMCQDKDYVFFVSKAEEVPKPEQLYDIVTAAGVIPWVDKDVFFEKLKSIIYNEAIVLVYDFWISDKMKNVPQYSDWYMDEYLKKFPKPPRNEIVWTNELICPYGFQMQKQITYQMEYTFNIDDFIKFMMIQSNVNAKIDGEGQNEEEIKVWFKDSLQHIFDSQERTLLFEGYSWYLSRVK